MGHRGFWALLALLLALGGGASGAENPPTSPSGPPPTPPQTAPQAEPAFGSGELPPFLKPYFAPLFEVAGQPLRYISRNQALYLYATADATVKLGVATNPCDLLTCKFGMIGVAQALDTPVTTMGGEIRLVTNAEVDADWIQGGVRLVTLAFATPTSTQSWTYIAPIGRPPPSEWVDLLRTIVDFERYQEAAAAGIMATAMWAPELHAFYRRLLDAGKNELAAQVLRVLTGAAPEDYEARLDQAVLSPEAGTLPETLKATAEAVLAGAENPALLDRAARILRQTRPAIGSLPPLAAGEEASTPGLRVVLIPLGGADAGLVAEAGRLYEAMTGIPVTLRRLPQPLDFQAFDRLPQEGPLRAAIVQKLGHPVDFTGWDLDRYEAALVTAQGNASALARFKARDWVETLKKRPHDYLAEAYLIRLGALIAPLRAANPKAIYVGVTEATLFSGEAAFAFETTGSPEGRYVGILGYGPMMAASTGEPFESRKRLAERIAKELAPATLKGLNLPRPRDETDPYSLSGNLARLDRKTLVLSQPTKDALAAAR